MAIYIYSYLTFSSLKQKINLINVEYKGNQLEATKYMMWKLISPDNIRKKIENI